MRARKSVFVPVTLAVLVALGWTIVWLASSSSLPKPGGRYHVTGVVPSAEFLGTGANVTIAGLKVGRVEKVKDEDGAARLSMALDPKYGPLPRDSRFGVRLRSVVGENYVEIVPGRSASDLPDGGVLGLEHADRYVNVDEILDTLKGPARQRARDALAGLASTVDGRGRDLNRTLGGLAGTVADAPPATRVLAADSAQISRLTDDLGVVAQTLGTRGRQIRSAAQSGTRTAEAIASRDRALRSVLTELPSTLTQIRRTTGTLAGVSGRATPVLLNVGRLLNDVRPATSRLRPAATAADRLVQELGRSAPPLTGVLDDLRRTAPSLTAALPPVRRVMCQLNPVASFLKPYAKDLGAVLPNMAYGTNAYDATGHLARLHLALGENELKVLSPDASRAVQRLLDLDVIHLSHDMAYDPFPAPGQAEERAKNGDPTGYTEVTKPYPHVQAEC